MILFWDFLPWGWTLTGLQTAIYVLGVAFFAKLFFSNPCFWLHLPPYPSHFSANLFLLISSILGSKMAGPHTQFVHSFMEECVECLEQGHRGSILQFLPFTMVSYRKHISTALFNQPHHPWLFTVYCGSVLQNSPSVHCLEIDCILEGKSGQVVLQWCNKYDFYYE